MHGFELWRGLAPRRFLIEQLLADFISVTEVLPADNANGVFAVITTSPLGLPQVLPEGWQEVDSLGEYFATFRAPAGTTAREAVEVLALELVPLFYPAESYRDKLIGWLQKELGDDPDTKNVLLASGEDLPLPDSLAPDPCGPAHIIDIPNPRDYHNIKSGEEEDLEFLYGSGRNPPSYHDYRNDFAAQDPNYGPPEVSDVAIQEAEEAAFLYY